MLTSEADPPRHNPMKVYHGRRCSDSACQAHKNVDRESACRVPWYLARPNDDDYPDKEKCGHASTPNHDDYQIINRHASARAHLPHDDSARKCQCISCLPNAPTNDHEDEDYVNCWNEEKIKPYGTVKDRAKHEEVIELALFHEQEVGECPHCQNREQVILRMTATNPEHQWEHGEMWCEHNNWTERMPKRLRSTQNASMNAERNNMALAARETEIQNQMEKMTYGWEQMHEQARATPSRPAALFAAGHSVQQFWASWMATAVTPPLQLAGNARGSWYSAQLLGWSRYGSIKYAGIQYNDTHIYWAH